MYRLASTCITFISIFLATTCLAQESQIADSITIAEMLKENETTASIGLDSALTINRQIVSLAVASGFKQLDWDARYQESDLLFKLGKKDSALTVVNDLLTMAVSQADTTRQIKALCQTSYIQQESYDFEAAIINLIRAQHLLTKNSDIDLQFDVLNYLGQTHRKMKDYVNALKYYGILEKNFLPQLSTEQRFLLYMNTGNVYHDQNKLDKVEELYPKAYNECTKLNQPDRLAQITYNLGNLYYRQNNFAEAKEYLNRALREYEKIGDQLRIEKCYRVLGALAYRQNQYLQAEKYYQKSYDIGKAVNNPKSLKSSLKNLYLNKLKIAEQTGQISDYKKAMEYQTEWTGLNDSLYQQDLAERMLELEKKYETEKKNAQIDLLAKENQLKAEELVIEQQQKRNMLLVIVTLILATIIIAYFVIYYRRFNIRLQAQSRLILNQKEQIASQNTQLQKAMLTRDKLFSIIAHDLRSPLVSVSNFVQLLNFYLRDGKYDSIQKMATEMDKKNQQVLELTDNLLKWARSQSEGMKVQNEKVSLTEILDECFELYSPIAQDKNITLIADQKGNCFVWADRDMLRTICRNLINNSIKFTPREGEVSVSYGCDEKYVRVSVKDTGIGISTDKINRLFNPEKNDVQLGTDGEKSSGLGLSVCKEFCGILQGKIEVESTEGLGSTFSFSLPKYSEELQELSDMKGKQATPAGL